MVSAKGSIGLKMAGSEAKKIKLGRTKTKEKAAKMTVHAGMESIKDRKIETKPGLPV